MPSPLYSPFLSKISPARFRCKSDTFITGNTITAESHHRHFEQEPNPARRTSPRQQDQNHAYPTEYDEGEQLAEFQPLLTGTHHIAELGRGVGQPPPVGYRWSTSAAATKHFTRTRFAQPGTASAPAAPIQSAQSFLSLPKRQTFCNSPAFCGKKTYHRPPSSPSFPQNPWFKHPRPR